MIETPSERLKEWYVNFIKIFNEEYVKLSDDEKKRFPTAHNCSSRCQIEVFWLKRPEWQLTITTHFQDRPDGEIIINGPYDSSIFPEEVEKIIQQERWNRTIDYDSAYHSIREIPHLYNELLARQLHSFIEQAKNALFSRAVEHTGVIQGQRIGKNDWIETYWGNYSNMDPHSFIQKIIADIKKEIEVHKQLQLQPSQPVPSKTESPKGYGVYFFPPIVIGKEQKLTPADILYGGTTAGLSMFDKTAFNTTFQKIPIIVGKDGHITACTEKKGKALKILNTIMAVAMLEGMDVFTVREHEFSEVRYNPETLAISGYTYNMKTLRDLLFQESWGKKFQLDYPKKEVSEEQIKKIIEKASVIYQQEQLSEELRILLEAVTHQKDSEFAQAFFMGWVIIERHISQIWYDKIHNKRIMDHERVNKLQNPGAWSIDYLIEVLNLEDDIEQMDYDVYMDLKRKRNHLMHSGKQIRPDDAERCVNVASEIIRKKISKLNNIS